MSDNIVKIEGKADIKNYCREHEISIIDFNEPVELQEYCWCNGLFDGCYSFNQPVKLPENASCGDLRYMFRDCYSFNNDVIFPDRYNGNNTLFSHMFDNCISLKRMIIPSFFNKEKVFNNCYSLEEVIIKDIDIFNNCSHESYTGNNFLHENFYNCINLKRVNELTYESMMEKDIDLLSTGSAHLFKLAFPEDQFIFKNYYGIKNTIIPASSMLLEIKNKNTGEHYDYDYKINSRNNLVEYNRMIGHMAKYGKNKIEFSPVIFLAYGETAGYKTMRKFASLGRPDDMFKITIFLENDDFILEKAYGQTIIEL